MPTYQKTFQNIYTSFLDTLAPPRCMNCLKEGTWLCDKCCRQFRTIPLICVNCEKQKPTGRTCSRCKNKTNLTGLISAGSYESQLLRRGIHWLKFKSIKDVAPALANFMMMRLNIISPIRQLQNDSALVPVPLHSKRQSSRGFNQSMVLSQAIGKALNIPIYDIVTREKYTLTQSNLPPELRSNNVENVFRLNTQKPVGLSHFVEFEAAPSIRPSRIGGNTAREYAQALTKKSTKLASPVNFRLRRKLNGVSAKVLPINRKLIIIDDVTTSASTLNAVAKPLQKTNPKEIWGLTIARG